MNSHSIIDIKNTPELAIEDISEKLSNGCLKLFLGAGVSKDFGLPSWNELLVEIIDRYNGLKGSTKIYITEERKGDTIFLQEQLDVIETDNRYIDIVQAALYKNISPNLDDRFLKNSPTLLALSALCLGSTRGRVKQIFSLNYDDVLEQYLNLLGLNVYSTFEHYTERKFSDIEIYHINGFLPSPDSIEERSKDIVLSADSFTSRYAKILEEIQAWLLHQMTGNFGLYIGLSGDDALFNTMLRTHKNERDKYFSTDSEYYGYWIMTPESYEKNSTKVVKNNICPIPLKVEDIPKFLLSCCKHASFSNKNYG